MKINIKVLFAVVLISILSITYVKISSSNFTDGNFEIPSTEGTYKLSQDRGRIVILYFGYRFCPDICPTTLSELSYIKKNLTPKEQKLLSVVFISLDPERDTIPVLDEYVKFFHPSFIGATASRKELDILVKIYGVRYKIHRPKGKNQTAYSVDHSAEAFIIGKDGKYKDIILYGEKNNVNLNKVRKYIGENI